VRQESIVFIQIKFYNISIDGAKNNQLYKVRYAVVSSVAVTSQLLGNNILYTTTIIKFIIINYYHYKIILNYYFKLLKILFSNGKAVMKLYK